MRYDFLHDLRTGITTAQRRVVYRLWILHLHLHRHRSLSVRCPFRPLTAHYHKRVLFTVAATSRLTFRVGGGGGGGGAITSQEGWRGGGGSNPVTAFLRSLWSSPLITSASSLLFPSTSALIFSVKSSPFHFYCRLSKMSSSLLHIVCHILCNKVRTM